jgi:2-methylcitrate dehydratase PrpD
VEVTLADGSVKSSTVDGPRGHDPRPASDADLLGKWRELTGEDGTELLARLDEVDDSARLDDVLPALPA